MADADNDGTPGIFGAVEREKGFARCYSALRSPRLFRETSGVIPCNGSVPWS
jgi:hypothetical protein